MTCKWQIVVNCDPGQKWPKPDEVWCLIWNDLFVSLEEWEVIQIRKSSTADGTSCQSVLAITLERPRTWANLLRRGLQLFACLSGGAGKKGESVLWGKKKVQECWKVIHCILKRKNTKQRNVEYKRSFFLAWFSVPVFSSCTLGPHFVFTFFLLCFDSELRKERVKGGKLFLWNKALCIVTT